MLEEITVKDNFQENGVLLQRGARGIMQAIHSYEHSCMLCALRNRPNDDCSICPIMRAYKENVNGRFNNALWNPCIRELVENSLKTEP